MDLRGVGYRVQPSTAKGKEHLFLWFKDNADSDGQSVPKIEVAEGKFATEALAWANARQDAENRGLCESRKVAENTFSPQEDPPGTSRLTSRSLAEQYPAKGSMPRKVVHQLYWLRETEIKNLSQQESIGVSDLESLDRGARFGVASLLYTKCDAAARNALLHDEHPHVRSCAELSQAERPCTGDVLKTSLDRKR